MGTLEQVRINLASADEEVRRQAIIEMRSLPFVQVEECLKRSLGDSSWRVRKEAVDLILSVSPGDRFMEDLVEMLRSDDNAGLRNSAVEVLERLGGRVVPVLHRFSRDTDHDVRKFVLDIMGSIRDASFVPVLIDALDDADANVSSAAAENLGKIGDARAVEPLLRSLSRTDVWFRHTVLQALGRIGRQIPVAPILGLIEEKLLKKAVYSCLGSIGNATATELLVDGLQERMRTAREAAVLALYRLYRRLRCDAERIVVTEKLHRYGGTPCVDGLLPLLVSDDLEVREAAIWSLGLIGDPQVVDSLLQGYREESTRNVSVDALKRTGVAGMDRLLSLFPSCLPEERYLIVYLIGEERYAPGASVVAASLEDPHPDLRRAAAVAAGQNGLVALIPEIASLLDDRSVRVRSGAIEALGRLATFDPEKVQSVASHLASDGAPEKRRDVVSLLLALGDADRLTLLAKDEDASVRGEAVKSLAELKSPGTAKHLIMALVDEDADVRIAAACALGAVGGEEALHALLLALPDDDPWVQCAVLKALGLLGDRVALPAISALVPGSDGLVVLEALTALARIDYDQSRQTFVQALGNDDSDVVKAAIDILSGGDDDRWIDSCRERLMNHPDWDVRCGFVRVLFEKRGSEAVPQLRAMLDVEPDDMVRNQICELLGREC